MSNPVIPGGRKSSRAIRLRHRAGPQRLLVGVYYLLIALGLSLIFSLGGIVNLAHGAFYAIGAYLTVALATGRLCRQLRAGAGRGRNPRHGDRAPAVPPLLSLLILVLALTFGLAMVAEQGLRMIFGAAPVAYAMPPELRGQVFIGDFIYSEIPPDDARRGDRRGGRHLGVIYRTPFGRVVRAGVQKPEMVGALGISLAPT